MGDQIDLHTLDEIKTKYILLPKDPEGLAPEQLEMLGRPNFMCSSLAHVLRLGGREIKQKAEAEQAAIIHWFLGLYQDHEKDWPDAVAREIGRIKEKLHGT